MHPLLLVVPPLPTPNLKCSRPQVPAGTALPLAVARPGKPQALSQVREHPGPSTFPAPTFSHSQDFLSQSGRNLRLLVGHCDSVQSSNFSPTSDSLVSFTPTTPYISGHEWQGLFQTCYCPQATGSWDSTVRIWDLRESTPVVSYRNLEGHTGNISCLCYSASGLLVS